MQQTSPIKAYLEHAIEGFMADKPDTDFQRGYLAALVETYKVHFGELPSKLRHLS